MAEALFCLVTTSLFIFSLAVLEIMLVSEGKWPEVIYYGEWRDAGQDVDSLSLRFRVSGATLNFKESSL